MMPTPTIRMLLILSLTLAGASLAIQSKVRAEPDTCYDCDDLPGKTNCREIPCPIKPPTGAATSTSVRPGLLPPQIDTSTFRPCMVENRRGLCRRRGTAS